MIKVRLHFIVKTFPLKLITFHLAHITWTLFEVYIVSNCWCTKLYNQYIRTSNLLFSYCFHKRVRIIKRFLHDINQNAYLFYYVYCPATTSCSDRLCPAKIYSDFIVQ